MARLSVTMSSKNLVKSKDLFKKLLSSLKKLASPQESLNACSTTNTLNSTKIM